MSNSENKNKKYIILGVIALIAIFVGWRVISKEEKINAEAASAAAAEKYANSDNVRGEGRVAAYPGGVVDVGTEVGGRLVRLLVSEQQQVKKGDLIAEFASEELQAALLEANAKVAEVDANITLLELEEKRATALKADKSISQQAYDKTVNTLASARAQKQVAIAAVKRIQASLAKSRIYAPISGSITARNVEEGEIVPAGTPLVTISDLTKRRIEAEIDEYDIGKLSVGDSVTITAEGYEGETWTGVLEIVPDAVNPRKLTPFDPGRPKDTRVLLIKVTLPQEAPIKLGQRVEVSIKAAQ